MDRNDTTLFISNDTTSKQNTLWQHCSNADITTPNVTTNELSKQLKKAALPQSTTEPIRNGSTMYKPGIKQHEESPIAILLSLSLANPSSPGTSPHLFLEMTLISFLPTRSSKSESCFLTKLCLTALVKGM